MTQLDFVEPDETPVFEIHRTRQKPVEIQSVKVNTDNLSQIYDWIIDSGHHAVLGDGQLIIQTLEGPFTVRPGDVVLRGIRGDFTRCDAELYADGYEDLGPVKD